LGSIKRFPIDILIIDRELINNLAEQDEDRVLVKAIVTMAHGLGIQVVGEGVKTEKQVDILKTLECDNVQGFHFSKPLPPNEFEQYLTQLHPCGIDEPLVTSLG
jgi:EAL domain-containing protein (putative c-di-GMP-specific phosphodiesterase class I)